MQVLLVNRHITHEVNVGTLRYAEVYLLHVKRGVLEYPQVAAETKVLLVVRHERHLYARVAVHLQRINYIESVEAYGILAYRRRERELQQANLVVIYVNLRKHLLGQSGKEVPRLQQVVHALAVLCVNVYTLFLGTLAVVAVKHLLVGDYRQHRLARYRIYLYLILKPLLLGIGTLCELFLCNVIERDCHLLIVTVLEEILVLQLRLLLSSNNTTHQLNGGIVLTGVFRFLRLHDNLLKVLRVRFQLYNKMFQCTVCHSIGLRLVAHGGERKVPADTTVN